MPPQPNWNSPWTFGNPAAPQMPGEPDAAYWLRRNIIAPVDPRNFVRGYNPARPEVLTPAVNAALDNPDARAARLRGGVVPNIVADAARRAAALPAPTAAQPSGQGQRGQAQQAGRVPVTQLFQFEGWGETGRPGDPRPYRRGTHAGWDRTPPGSDRNIRAAQPFEIIAAGQSENGGNMATVQFASGQTARVMHLAQPAQVGLRGVAGDTIGIAGRTGRGATGIHAHVEEVGAPATSPGMAFAALAGTTPPGMEAWNNYAGLALEQIDQAQAAANTPWAGSFDMATPPALPAPADFQAPDFAQGNKAFEAARPRHPFEQAGSESRMLRENFFRGMAEAMLSVPTGRPVGFGELLLRAGAGGLGGRMRGAEEVRQRMDRYDGLMQQYNTALASRNDSQATATANVINQNIAADNQHAYQQAAQNLQEFHRRNRVELQGNSVIVYRAGEGGRQNVSVTPVPSLNAAHWGQLRAQVLLQGAGAAQQNSQWSWQQANTMALSYAALGIGQGGTPAAEGESLAFALGSVVVPLADSGMLPDAIGHDNYNQIRGYFEAAHPVDPRQIMSPADNARRQAQMHDYIAQRVVRDAMGNQELAARLLSIHAGVAARAVARVRTQRTTVNRGRTGVRTSESYEAATD